MPAGDLCRCVALSGSRWAGFAVSAIGSRQAGEEEPEPADAGRLEVATRLWRERGAGDAQGRARGARRHLQAGTKVPPRARDPHLARDGSCCRLDQGRRWSRRRRCAPRPRRTRRREAGEACRLRRLRHPAGATRTDAQSMRAHRRAGSGGRVAPVTRPHEVETRAVPSEERRSPGRWTGKQNRRRPGTSQELFSRRGGTRWRQGATRRARRYRRQRRHRRKRRESCSSHGPQRAHWRGNRT